MSNEILNQVEVNGKLIQAVYGDLTLEEGAIVNPANSHLQHMGGAARIIASRGGMAIVNESDAWVVRHGPVLAGQVAVTSAGSLPAKVVIHAVGPVWGRHDKQEANLLRSAVRESILAAEANEVSTLSIPAISSGIFGGDKEECCQLIVAETFRILETEELPNLCRVRLIANDEPTAKAFVSSIETKLLQS